MSVSLQTASNPEAGASNSIVVGEIRKALGGEKNPHLYSSETEPTPRPDPH